MSISQCPKCGYERQASDRHVNALVCPACGIAYQKWIDRNQAGNSPHKPNPTFVDLSPYIADAQNRFIPLVGGASEDFHDWGNLLDMMNLLDSTRTLARFDFGLGATLMLLASAWGAYVLFLQKKNIQ